MIHVMGADVWKRGFGDGCGAFAQAPADVLAGGALAPSVLY
ncbi:hypothetical protein R75483_02531 [Paraburkholderia domus]|nr:hypothetical protein R75483_02531 [Paraburkholderia domus]